MPALQILLGLGALTLGAELVVRHGARLASRAGIPPILVGLTVVSIGTSLPELAIGIDAVRSGAGSLALGNIAGTNVVNLLLILGLSAAIRPIVLGMQTLRVDLPAMAIASAAVLALSLDGVLSVVDGAILLAMAIGYTGLLIVAARREAEPVVAEFAAEYPAEVPEAQRGSPILGVGLLLVGLAVIVVGAHLLVEGAVSVAQDLGVSDALIGLTIVAIGTSAPEFATTMIATIRGDRDIAIGNLIGSSTYNLTFILGGALVFTNGTLPVDHQLLTIDLPIMIGVALLCIPVFRTGRMVSRWEGIAFVALYVAYFSYLLIART